MAVSRAQHGVAAASGAPDIAIRRYDAADEPAVLDLLQQSLAGGPTGRRTGEFFRWKHERNHFGRSFALVAELDGKLVGFRTFMRWRFAAEGQIIEAVRAVDTATHPGYQGLGIFTRLTRAAIEELGDRIQLIFNTPNDQSLPGYRKLGWDDVGRIPIALRIVRPLRFARGIRYATQGASAGSPPTCSLPPIAKILADDRAIAELLYESTDPCARLATDRSIPYLRWRYTAAPDLDYRGLAIPAGNGLAGLAIVRPRKRGPLDELTLSEILVRRNDRRTTRQLLRAVARVAGDHVTAHLAADTMLPAAGRRLGYWVAPGQGITLVAKPLAVVRPDPLLLRSWRLALGDLEVF